MCSHCLLHVRISHVCFTFKAKSTWWNELVCTGLFALGLGIFLIVLNCLISKREEDDLEEYVQRALTRTRSGHRLERDVETGGLTTRQNRRSKSQHQIDGVTSAMGVGNGMNGGADNLGGSHSSVMTPESSEMMTPTTPHGNREACCEIICIINYRYGYKKMLIKDV